MKKVISAFVFFAFTAFAYFLYVHLSERNDSKVSFEVEMKHSERAKLSLILIPDGDATINFENYKFPISLVLKPSQSLNRPHSKIDLLTEVDFEPDEFPLTPAPKDALLIGLGDIENANRLSNQLAESTSGVINLHYIKFMNSTSDFTWLLSELGKKGKFFMNATLVNTTGVVELTSHSGTKKTIHARVLSTTEESEIISALNNLSELARKYGAAIGIFYVSVEIIDIISSWTKSIEGAKDIELSRMRDVL